MLEARPNLAKLLEGIMLRPRYTTSPGGIRPEVELLLNCARTHIDPQRAERIKTLLQQDIDWIYLIRIMLPHGMLPLFYRNLKASCPEAVPSVTLEQLERQFDAHTLRSLFLANELVEIINLFKAHGIIAIPFKGPALAASAYGDLSLRQFADLDILVKKTDVFRAKELLAFRSYHSLSHSTTEGEAINLESHYVSTLLNDDKRVLVELHWAIAPKYFSCPLEMDRLWDDLEPLSLAGAVIDALPPDKLLLLLCVHGSKHHWERLVWICDIAEMIRSHQNINWERLIDEACKLRVRRMLFLGLFLASEMLEARIPKEVLQRIHSEPVIKALAAQVCERIFPKKGDLNSLSENPVSKEGLFISLIFFHLKAREHLLDRTLYSIHVARLAMTPTASDRAFVRLPGFLSYFYYLLRPIRLVREFGLSPFKSLVQSLTAK
jgi:hypothetical protein